MTHAMGLHHQPSSAKGGGKQAANSWGKPFQCQYIDCSRAVSGQMISGKAAACPCCTRPRATATSAQLGKCCTRVMAAKMQAKAGDLFTLDDEAAKALKVLLAAEVAKPSLTSSAIYESQTTRQAA